MENQYDNEENNGSIDNASVSFEKSPEPDTRNKMDPENPYPVYTPSPDREQWGAQQESQNQNGQNPPSDRNGADPSNPNGYGGPRQQEPWQNDFGSNQTGSDYFYNSQKPNRNYYEEPNQGNSSYYSPNEPQRGKGMAIASLVLGVLSIISFCCVYLPIFLGITGVVLGLLSKNGNQKLSTEALIGIILSAVGVVISIGMIAIVMYLYKSGIYDELLNMSSTGFY